MNQLLMAKKLQRLPEVKTAWKQFADAGLLCAQHEYELGGMQLPTLINMAANAYFMSANPSTVAYSFLTAAAANVIQAFGTTEQKDTFVTLICSVVVFQARWRLTEPDVGSSLGDLTTKAIPQADGTIQLKVKNVYFWR